MELIIKKKNPKCARISGSFILKKSKKEGYNLKKFKKASVILLTIATAFSAMPAMAHTDNTVLKDLKTISSYSVPNMVKATAAGEYVTTRLLAASVGYKITLNYNGGDGSLLPDYVMRDSEGILTSSLPTPARDGYTFKGWWTKKSGGIQVNESTEFSKAITIYAQWEEAQTSNNGANNDAENTESNTSSTSTGYTITLNFNGGDSSLYNTSLTTDSNGYLAIGILLLTVPKRTGYSFQGWWTTKDESGSQVYDKTSGTPTKFVKNTTIYAHWQENVTNYSFSIGVLPSVTYEDIELGDYPEPVITDSDSEEILTKETDYTLSYSYSYIDNNTTINTDTFTDLYDTDNNPRESAFLICTVTGIGNYSSMEGYQSCAISTEGKPISEAIAMRMTGSKTYQYEGKSYIAYDYDYIITYGNSPKAVIYYSNYNDKLTEGEDYTIEYENIESSGVATCVIEGTGDYYGTATVDFYILDEDGETDVSDLADAITYGEVVSGGGNSSEQLANASVHLKKTYTISYTSANAGAANYVKSKIPSKTVYAGDPIGSLPCLGAITYMSKVYAFNGWSKTCTSYSDTPPSTVNETESVTSDLTLYAYWKTGETLTIYLYTGGGTISSVEINSGNWKSMNSQSTTYTKTGVKGCVIGTLPTPTREGYIFAGWASTSGEIVSSSTILSTTTNNLYAMWTSVDNTSYTNKITFDANGGKIEGINKSSITVVLNTKDNALYGNSGNGGLVPRATKDNCVFLGWTSSKNGSTYLQKTTRASSTTTTWYAKWKNLDDLNLKLSGTALVSQNRSATRNLGGTLNPYKITTDIAFTVNKPSPSGGVNSENLYISNELRVKVGSDIGYVEKAKATSFTYDMKGLKSIAGISDADSTYKLKVRFYTDNYFTKWGEMKKSSDYRVYSSWSSDALTIKRAS